MPTIARAPVAILPNVGMSQSGLMISALLAGFVVYLAIKQRLGVYWAILIGGGAAASPTATAPSTPSTPQNYGGGLVQPQSPQGIPVPGAGVQTTPGMQGN